MIEAQTVWPMLATLTILFVTVIFFIIGKFRSDAVAFCALLAMVLAGVLTPEEALSGFSNTVIMTIACVFILGAAIVRSGLAEVLGQFIRRLGGTNQNLLFMLVMLMTAIIGSLVSNTGTVAIMMPIVASMAATINVSSSRFLMPLAFMSSIGGMLTLIGNPANMVVNAAYVKAGFQSMTLFSFLPVGIVSLIFGLLVLAPATSFFLSRRKNELGDKKEEAQDLRSLADKYGLAQHLFRMVAPAGSELTGKTLAELDLGETYGVMLQEVRRANPGGRNNSKPLQISPNAQTVLHPGDILYGRGSQANIDRLAQAFGLEPVQVGHTDRDLGFEYRFEAFGICELVLMSSSSLIKSTIVEARLRERFGITVLGILRGDQVLHEALGHEILQAGDSLLVQGPWDKIQQLKNHYEKWVVVGLPVPPPSQELRKKMPFVVIVLLLMILAMATSLLPTVICVMLATAALIAGGLFRSMEEVYTTVNWEPLILIACMMPMAVAMEKTGLVNIAAQWIIGLGRDFGPVAALALVYGLTSLLNIFISNTPLAVLVAPVGLTVAAELGLNPLPFIFAVAVAACMSFANPYSTPANALVMSAGRYTFLDYLKIGVPLQILMAIYMVVILPLLYPF